MDKNYPSLDNPLWKYIPANKTDISKTFERIKREMKEKEKEQKEKQKQ